jgi:hypothetical protein
MVGHISDFQRVYPNLFTDDWWSRMSYRFYCNPYITRPLNARQMAQAAPYFVGGCSQFIVEYAGDFLTQNPLNGAPMGQTPYAGDGIIDFVADGAGVRKVRWYGMPRNTDGDADVDIFDVVPLRDLRAGYPSTFEKVVPTPQRQDDYVGRVPSGARYFCAWSPADLAKESKERPLMFRITLAIEDSAGRLAEAPVYEYVVKLGL